MRDGDADNPLMRMPWATLMHSLTRQHRGRVAGILALAVLWCAIGPARAADAIDTERRPVAAAASSATPPGVARRLRELLSNPHAAALAPGLYLQSTVADLRAEGQVLARLPLPLAQVRAALRSPAAWCLLLMLHPNVWRCEVPGPGQGDTTLQILMGQQRVTVIGSTHTLALTWKLARDDEAGLALELMAEQGPLGTRDYRIAARIEALDESHSALELRYSSVFTRAGLWLAELYVNTAGRHRIGFTVEGVDAKGQTLYVRGLRGSVERNTMRFHLAVQSWLGVQMLPMTQRIPRAIDAWWEASAPYAAQLHEMEREAYVQMKLQQYNRHGTTAMLGGWMHPGQWTGPHGRSEGISVQRARVVLWAPTCADAGAGAGAGAAAIATEYGPPRDPPPGPCGWIH